MPIATKNKPTKTNIFGCDTINPDDLARFTLFDLEWTEAFLLCLFVGITNSLGFIKRYYRENLNFIFV